MHSLPGLHGAVVDDALRRPDDGQVDQSGADVVAAQPDGVNFSKLWEAFARPLLLSQAIALVVGAILYLALRRVQLAPDHRTPALDTLHFLSGGAVCFARGLNDTPKMAALLAAARAIVEQEGIGELSLRAVARRAGVSHSAPYHHFSDKAAVLAAVAAAGFDQLVSEIETDQRRGRPEDFAAAFKPS